MTNAPETPLSRALRKLAMRKRLSSLDVPMLDDAADELDELTATVAALRMQLDAVGTVGGKATVATRRAP